MNHRADSVVFGFDFQVNAAIILMLNNIKELSTLRLEGNYEDIEIQLNNGEYILAQAKSIVNGSFDFRNVRTKLKEALSSLSDGSKSIQTKQLILITNSSNPLNDDATKTIFWGPSFRRFSTLPPSAQQIIKDYVDKKHLPLDLEKFIIQTFSFETDDEEERYKFVLQKINDFVGDIDLSAPGLAKKLMTTWHEDVFINGSKKNASIKLTKKQIVWPLIVLTTDNNRYNTEFIDQFESGVYEEVTHHYSHFIDSKCEKFEFMTQVLYDYHKYDTKKPMRQKCESFIADCWKNYIPDFSIDEIDPEVQEALIKIILHCIIQRRFAIQKIQKGVNI